MIKKKKSIEVKKKRKLMLSLSNMPLYAWMCLHKQDSEYAWNPKYAKILSMAGFSICEHYAVFWICQNMPWQSSEYILVSKYARILNMQELHRVLNMQQSGWIWLNKMWNMLGRHPHSTYAQRGRGGVTPNLNNCIQGGREGLIFVIFVHKYYMDDSLNMSEFKIIDKVLNMHHTMHNARSLCMLMSTYWETSIFRIQSMT